jgi:acyl-coenzyme A thioesterase PaaI-like protein
MTGGPERLFHHELCFGCGQQNLFGLQLELEPRSGGGVGGRFFVKQDHQGPLGHAHRGVIAAALEEAIALVLHADAATAGIERLEVEFHAPAPVGTFVRVEANLGRGEAVATASGPDGPLASGRATLERT